jgi:hypothetical protein
MAEYVAALEPDSQVKIRLGKKEKRKEETRGNEGYWGIEERRREGEDKENR